MIWRHTVSVFACVCLYLCVLCVYRHASLGMFVSLFTDAAHLTISGSLTLTCSRWQAQSDGDGHFPGRSGHTVRDGFCVAVTRHYQTAHTAPHTPQAHEDDHIWYTDDILSLLWQHELIFLLWHPLLCGCYSSQIYHFNGEVVRPEDYLRDKYIIVCSFGIDRVSLCPDLLFQDECLKIPWNIHRCNRLHTIKNIKWTTEASSRTIWLRLW